MLKSLKIICFYLLTVDLICCDGNVWIREEESVSELNSDVPLTDTTILDLSNTTSSGEETTASEAQSETTEFMNTTETQSSSSSESTESGTTSTEKPPPKQFGCATRLWTGGQKFCWSRCDSASTSNLWNTWCFTTNTTSKQADYIECQTDDQCQPDWKCFSSCGIFSPHWDRDTPRLEEALPSFDSNKTFV